MDHAACWYQTVIPHRVRSHSVSYERITFSIPLEQLDALQVMSLLH